MARICAREPLGPWTSDLTISAPTKSSQPSDALLRRRVGCEQLANATCAERRERVHLREWCSSRRDAHRDAMRGHVELRQRVGQRQRTPADLRADRVGLELPLPADRELN